MRTQFCPKGHNKDGVGRTTTGSCLECRKIAVRRVNGAIRSDIGRMKEENPCTDCRQYYPAYVMTYDHLDASKKTDHVSRLVAFGKREDVLKEIAKCELVCFNCHAVRTHKRRIAPETPAA